MNIKGKTHYCGGISIAIVLMIAGWAIEIQDDYLEYQGIGTIMFTIGFWLFVIPFIIIAVILGIMGVILVLKR